MRTGDSYEELKDLPNLHTETLGRPFLITETTTSTNDDAKLLADEGLLGHGAVLLAKTQSGGKGRLNRRWASPKGGVFMSVILKPEVPPAKVPGLSLAVGYSVACALREDFGLDSKIKWPNDVLVSGRKVSGILCEMKAEEDQVNYVVAGIGVNANLRTDDFPPEIRDTATSMAIHLGHHVDQDLVAASILNHLEPVYEEYVLRGLTSLADRMTSVAAYLGERVIVRNRVAPGSEATAQTREAEAAKHLAGRAFAEGVFLGIDAEGRLLLNTGGTLEAYDVGDLSLRIP